MPPRRAAGLSGCPRDPTQIADSGPSAKPPNAATPPKMSPFITPPRPCCWTSPMKTILVLRPLNPVEPMGSSSTRTGRAEYVFKLSQSDISSADDYCILAASMVGTVAELRTTIGTSMIGCEERDVVNWIVPFSGLSLSVWARDTTNRFAKLGVVAPAASGVTVTYGGTSEGSQVHSPSSFAMKTNL